MKKFIYYFLPFFYVTAHAQIIHRVAGMVAVNGYTGDGGPATLAKLQNPTSVALDTVGNLYITDGDVDVIRMVDTAGTITTIAGKGLIGYSGDGGPATEAMLNSPIGLSIDKAGNIYFADWGNHVVRMISTTGIITTVAGSGMAGYSGDGGAATAARLNDPYATAVDGIGNLYICDFSENVIRKVTVTGIITTVAGDSINGYSGDGGAATNAELSVPSGVAVDESGNVFIADNGNNVIRTVNTAGIITTIAGNGISGYSGDGGPATAAKLATPWSIGINKLGIYITDYNNYVIRKIDASGIITTVAGCGINGYSGDGGLAAFAKLKYPVGMAIDRDGDFYFTDVLDYVVREVDTSHAKESINVVAIDHSLSLFPNPVINELTVASSENITGLTISNVLGQLMYIEPKSAYPLQLHINAGNFPPGIYCVSIGSAKAATFVKE